MLPLQIVRILNVFHVCGFIDSGSSKISNNLKLRRLIWCIHISLVVILTLFKMYMILQYYPMLRLTEAISEIVQYSTALNTVWMFILDSCVYRQAQHGFWIILQKIDKEFCSQSRCYFRSYLMKFFEFFSINILVMVLTLIASFISVVINIAYFTLFTICAIRMVYYLFCLEVVQFQLKMIENELKAMQIDHTNCIDARNVSHNKIKFSHFEAQRFNWMRGYFHCISEMVALLNKAFGWTQLAGITFCFSFVLTELHWMYLHFHELGYMHRIGNCHTFFFFIKSLEFGCFCFCSCSFQPLHLSSLTGNYSFYIYSTVRPIAPSRFGHEQFYCHLITSKTWWFT